MLTRFALLAALGLTLSFGACAGKTADQRDSLAKQNAELSQQLADARKAQADAEARAAAANNTAAAAPSTPDMTAPEAAAPAGSSAGAVDLGNDIKVTRNKNKQEVIEIPGDVLFDSGKATLKPAAMKSLDKVAALIKKQYAGQQLRLEGHTDPSPVKHSSWDDNYDLGFVRARAVMKYLVSKGVSEKSMYAASFGSNELKSTKNFALDRRVDIVVVNSGK